MHELIEAELYQALAFARGLDEDQGKQLMMGFERDQPLFFQTLFNTFASILTTHEQGIAYLFMDLCFDTVAVYNHAFGAMPKMHDDPKWMERQAITIDQELRPIMENATISPELSRQMKEKFFEAKDGEIIQKGLIALFNEAIEDYAEENACKVSTVELAETMMFVVVRLFTNLYTQPTKH